MRFNNHCKENVKIKELEKQNQELIARLEDAIWFQEKSKSYIEHLDSCNIFDNHMPEDESCLCGLDSFANDNYLSIQLHKQTLAKVLQIDQIINKLKP